MKKLKKYCGDNKLQMIMLGILIFITHGSKLFQNTISIDTEIVINEAAWEYQTWNNVARPSLTGIKFITNMLQYNPYLANALTLFFLFCFCVLVGYFSYRISGNNKGSVLFILSAVFVTHPILTEQLSFDLQSMEIALGFSTVLGAAYFTLKWAETNKWEYICISIFLAVFSFFLYQSFVFIYVIFIIGFLFIKCFGKEKCIQSETISEVKWIDLFKSILTFGISMLLYGVLTKLFFSGSGYLNTSNYWSFSTPKENVFRIINNIYLYFIGDSIFHTAYMGIFIFLLIILSIAEIKKKENKILACLILLGELLSPFLMMFALGGPPQAYRAEIDVVVAEVMLICCVLIVVNMRAYKNGFIKKCMIIGIGACIILLGWEQLNITTRLYYTDSMCYEHGVMMAHQIGKEIDAIIAEEEHEYPVYISGKRIYEGNKISLMGEAMGHSFFGWVDGVYWHNKRSLHFMRVQGYSYEALPEESALQMQESNVAEDMPIWPASGSIALKDGVIIVKLSE